LGCPVGGWAPAWGVGPAGLLVFRSHEKRDLCGPQNLAHKITIAQEETIPNIWNGTMFGDID